MRCTTSHPSAGVPEQQPCLVLPVKRTVATVFTEIKQLVLSVSGRRKYCLFYHTERCTSGQFCVLYDKLWAMFFFLNANYTRRTRDSQHASRLPFTPAIYNCSNSMDCGTGLSQTLYLKRQTRTQKPPSIHPIPERDSNQRPHSTCNRRQCVP